MGKFTVLQIGYEKIRSLMGCDADALMLTKMGKVKKRQDMASGTEIINV